MQLSFGLDGLGLNGLKRPSLCADADDCQWTVVLQSCSACDEQAATGLKEATTASFPYYPLPSSVKKLAGKLALGKPPKSSIDALQAHPRFQRCCLCALLHAAIPLGNHETQPTTSSALKLLPTSA